MKKYILLAIILLVPTSFVSACDPHAGCRSTQLGELRFQLGNSMDSNLMRDLEFQQVLEISRIVLNGITPRNYGTGVGLRTPTNAFYANNTWNEFTQENQEFGAICGDYQYFAAHAFGAFGIESRYASMFENVTYQHGPVNSHASTEVWVHDKWVAVDLTFGVYFEGLLSWEEVRSRLAAGEEVTHILIPTERTDMPTLENYYRPLSELTKNMIIEGCSVRGNACWYQDETKEPWTGYIENSETSGLVHWPSAMVGWYNALESYWTQAK